jgi:AcrR family transcriptional regulator
MATESDRAGPHSEQALAWLDRAVDFVTETGLQQLTLRPLAAHLGTSDRMILYHFGSKERLLEAVIGRASERLGQALQQSLDPPPRRPVDVLSTLWAILTSDETSPYVRLYLELLIEAMRDPDTYGDIVQRISAGWLAVTQQLLSATGARLPRTAAIDALATIDGLILARAALGADVDAPAALRRLARSWSAAGG